MSRSVDRPQESAVVAFLKRRWLAIVIVVVTVVVIAANRDEVDVQPRVHPRSRRRCG